MRWNGKNFRPRGIGRQPINPQPVNVGRGLNTSKAKWVATYWAGPAQQSSPPQQNYKWLGMAGHGTGETWVSEDDMSTFTLESNVPVGAWAYTTYKEDTDFLLAGRNYVTSYNTKGFIYSTDKGITWTEGNDTLSSGERPRVGDYSPTLGGWFWKTYYQNRIATSTDGINWTEIFVSSGNATHWVQWLPEYGLFHQQKESSTFYYSETLSAETIGSETKSPTGGGYTGPYPGGLLQNSQGEYFAIKHNRGENLAIYETTNGKDWLYDGNLYAGYNFRCEPRATLTNADGYLISIPQLGGGAWSGIYSDDDGATWTPFTPTDNTSDPAGFNIRGAFLDPNGTTIYAACARNGIIKSTDGGFTWEDHFLIAGGCRSVIAIPE